MNVLRDLGKDNEPCRQFVSQEILEFDEHKSYIVDFLHKDWQLVIECDGKAYHSSEEQRRYDAIRQWELTCQGYKRSCISPGSCAVCRTGSSA